MCRNNKVPNFEMADFEGGGGLVGKAQQRQRKNQNQKQVGEDEANC